MKKKYDRLVLTGKLFKIGLKNERAVNVRDVKFMIRRWRHAAWNAFKMRRAFSSIRFSFFYVDGYARFSRWVFVKHGGCRVSKHEMGPRMRIAEILRRLFRSLHRNNAELFIP